MDLYCRSQPTGSDLDAAEEEEGVRVPRKQRNTRRRLSFSRRSSPVRRQAEAEVARGMERRTSGIYDLIDAIGLLGEPPSSHSIRSQ